MSDTYSPRISICGRFAFSFITLFCLMASSLPAVTIDTVPIGNPGNAADTNGLGAVGYAYRIGAYDVTVSQYTTFLNAVDPAGTNGLSLYDEVMGTSEMGGVSFDSDATTGAKYSVISGHGANPITYATWFDALRFVNWLNNGQGAGDTEVD